MKIDFLVAHEASTDQLISKCWLGNKELGKCVECYLRLTEFKDGESGVFVYATFIGEDGQSSHLGRKIVNGTPEGWGVKVSKQCEEITKSAITIMGKNGRLDYDPTMVTIVTKKSASTGVDYLRAIVK